MRTAYKDAVQANNKRYRTPGILSPKPAGSVCSLLEYGQGAKTQRGTPHGIAETANKLCRNVEWGTSASIRVWLVNDPLLSKIRYMVTVSVEEGVPGSQTTSWSAIVREEDAYDAATSPWTTKAHAHLVFLGTRARNFAVQNNLEMLRDKAGTVPPALFKDSDVDSMVEDSVLDGITDNSHGFADNLVPSCRLRMDLPPFIAFKEDKGVYQPGEYADTFARTVGRENNKDIVQPQIAHCFSSRRNLVLAIPSLVFTAWTNRSSIYIMFRFFSFLSPLCNQPRSPLRHFRPLS